MQNERHDIKNKDVDFAELRSLKPLESVESQTCRMSLFIQSLFQLPGEPLIIERLKCASLHAISIAVLPENCMSARARALR